MSDTTWTNITIRQHLGERGFLKQDGVWKHGGVQRTYWNRAEQTLELHEFEDGRAPRLYHYGRIIDPKDIGVRNPNISENPTT